MLLEIHSIIHGKYSWGNKACLSMGRLRSTSQPGLSWEKHLRNTVGNTFEKYRWKYIWEMHRKYSWGREWWWLSNSTNSYFHYLAFVFVSLCFMTNIKFTNMKTTAGKSACPWAAWGQHANHVWDLNKLSVSARFSRKYVNIICEIFSTTNVYQYYLGHCCKQISNLGCLSSVCCHLGVILSPDQVYLFDQTCILEDAIPSNLFSAMQSLYTFDIGNTLGGTYVWGQ